MFASWLKYGAFINVYSKKHIAHMLIIAGLNHNLALADTTSLAKQTIFHLKDTKLEQTPIKLLSFSNRILAFGPVWETDLSP